MLAESYSWLSSDESIQCVVPTGDRRAALVAIRDRLAAETSNTLWSRHKEVCHCECGMGDGRMLVALVKELRTVIAELDALPVTDGVSRLDQLAAAVDELAPRRARGGTNAASSSGA